MADSFCLIPSKSEPSLNTLKKENLTLKADLEETQKQLALAERTLKQKKEQDMQLRDSIMLARKEVCYPPYYGIPLFINCTVHRRKGR